MKDNYIRLHVLLNKKTDADIIQHLEQQKNKSEYVKDLIRKDIASDE